jgi:cardiolipin synthase (CMP-forming)
LPINLPNILTIIRILLVPVFVIYLQKNMFMPALIIFTIAGVSDGLDGLLARYLNQKTILGAHLDPLADKLLLAAAFVTLSIIQCIPDWLTVIVISRDILIMLGVGVCIMLEIKVEIKPSFVSKCTTVSQLLTVFLVLLYLSLPGTAIIPDTYARLLYMTTACLTIISGLHYIYKNMNIHQKAEE